MVSAMATAQFLNVDLDLRDEAGVTDLVRALEPQMVVLHQDETIASLELYAPAHSLDEVLNRPPRDNEAARHDPRGARADRLPCAIGQAGPHSAR